MKTRRFIYIDKEFAYVSCELIDTDKTLMQLMNWMRKLEYCKGVGEFTCLMNDINKFYGIHKGLFYKEKQFNILDYKWDEYVYVKIFDEHILRTYNYWERVLV